MPPLHLPAPLSYRTTSPSLKSSLDTSLFNWANPFDEMVVEALLPLPVELVVRTEENVEERVGVQVPREEEREEEKREEKGEGGGGERSMP